MIAVSGSARIVLTPAPEGIAISLLCDERPLPVARWSTTAPLSPDLRCAIETAVHLAASGEAEEDEDAILAPHLTVARLEPNTARRLQLPPPSPYRVAVDHVGILPDKDFALRVRYLDDRGREIIGARRLGALLSCGDHLFVISEPIFSALNAIDDFNRHPPVQHQDRLAFLARLHSLLAPPAHATLDPYLRGFRIHWASAVALLLRVDRCDELTLEPLLLRPRVPAPAEEEHAMARESAPDLVVALSREQHQAFCRQLRQRKDVLPRFVLGSGQYLILPPHLQQLLAGVKRLNSLPPEQRLKVLRSPRVFLRDAVADCSDEEFDALLIDLESLSDRISHLGEWAGVPVPPRPPSGVQWTPDQVPLVVAGQVVMIAAFQLPGLLQRLRKALAEDQREFEVNGTFLPVTAEVIVAIEKILAFFELDESASGDAPTTTVPPRRTRALHVLDNIEWEAFRRQLSWRAPLAIVESATVTPLLAHQRSGVQWLARSWQAGWPGVILADDMGLGKTLQVLLLVAALQECANTAGRAARVLVVAPTGLLANWRAEAERHGLRSSLGDPLDVARLSCSSPTELQDHLRHAPWALVSYERLRDHELAFAAIPWTLVIFDEAQRIKNPAARLTNAAKALRADFFVALTATPVENSLADLWCIADAVAPGTLGALTGFLRWCERPEHLAQLPEKLFTTRDGMPPLVLRRLKAGSLPGLPPKHVLVRRRAMPDVQAAAYARTHEQTRTVAGRIGVLAAIQRFRMVSLDPLPRDWFGPDEEYVAASARLTVLVEVLDEIAERGEKALIFVEALHVQARLLGLLQRRYGLSLPPLVINGQVAGRDRLARVESFQRQENFSVLLLSPRAGGVGLNLVAANHVIHLSRWWNPAVEDQCTDRAFRIGQSQPVFVYYPLAIHPGLGPASFDARLEELLSRKRVLAARALAPVAPTAEELADLIR